MRAPRVKVDEMRARAERLAVRFTRERQRVLDAEAACSVELSASDEKLRADFERAFSERGDVATFRELSAEFRRARLLVIGDYRSAPWLKHHAADVARKLKARAFATDALDHRTGAPITGLTRTSRAALIEAVETLWAHGIDVVAVGAPGVRDPVRRAALVAGRLSSAVPSVGPTVAFIGEHLVTSEPVRTRFPSAPSLIFDHGVSPASPLLRRLRADSPRFIWPLHPSPLKVHAFVTGDDPAFDIDPCRLDDAFRAALSDLKRVFRVAIPRLVAKTRITTPFSVDAWRYIPSVHRRDCWTRFIRGESVALPDPARSLIVLGVPSREHLLEETTHILRAHFFTRNLPGPPRAIYRMSPNLGFLEGILQEALGFAASRIANPRRKPPTLASLLSNERALARLALQALRRRTVPNIGSLGRINADDWNAAIHAVGYFIGRRIDTPRDFQRLLVVATPDAPSVLCDLLSKGRPSKT